MNKKLYLIDLGHPLNEYYVVEADPTAAYKKLRSDLDKRDYGFSKDREMKTIALIADSDEYGDCCIRIYL